MLNDHGDDGPKKNVKPVDLEAQMKRKLNRRRKEHQVYLHKVSLLSWVAHGNFVNIRLNDGDLMKSALALLPKNKNHCYPRDKTDLDYFQQITKWFKSTIELRNKKMYCDLKPRPPIMMSLALQMKFKAAICGRDYVLIFVILLRAIGIQCRMVQSLVLAPIYPPKSDLLSLAKKAEEKPKSSSSSSNKSKSSGSSKSKSKSSSSKHNSSSKKSSSSSKSKKSSKPEHKKDSPEKTSRSSRSKSKKASDPPVIPQLDGGDDKPTTSKLRKTPKLKALPGYQVDESYVDLAKDENSNPKIPKQTVDKSRGESSQAVTKMAPKVRFSLDSPNRASPSQKSVKNKNSPGGSKSIMKKVQEKASLQVFSPRKTRSMSHDGSPQPEASKKSKSILKTSEGQQKKIEKTVEVKKDSLAVFSPRRLRSRSRSAEEDKAPTTMKPNLKNLQDRKRPSSAKEEVEVKKSKVIAPAAGKKRSAETEEVPVKKAKPSKKTHEPEEEFQPDSDESTKFFKDLSKKSTKKKPKASASTEIDRRILSSDSEPEDEPTSPSKQSKGIDIWVEVYSEQDERWIAIDVVRGKVVKEFKEIVKTATHPMTYVFAWNNDKSLKDVSARYCANLNTVVRKMRVDSKYLEAMLRQFAGQKTSRDVKEDDELNKLQLEKPMPTSIAQ